MVDDSDYHSLSRRFQSFAERASDPLLANAYRRLAQTYQTLDYWRERFRQRHEEATREVAAAEADTAPSEASQRGER